jgi:hypothetical protein
MLQQPDEAPVRDTRDGGDAVMGAPLSAGRPVDLDAGAAAPAERVARGPASRAVTMMRSLWIIVRERFRD